MTRHQLWKIVATTAGSAFMVAASANLATAASFQRLGYLSTDDVESSARSISADGTTVVGYSSGNNGAEAFIWDETNGMRGLGDLAGGSFSSEAFSVSVGGKVVGSSSSNNGIAAFIWDETNGMQGLDGTEGFDFSRARAISSDGQTIVGSRQIDENLPNAFIWNETNGMQGLSDLEGGSDFSRALGVSANGAIVVGASSSEASGHDATEAVIWDASSLSLQQLGDLADGVFNSRAFDSSADGTTVVGYGSSSDGTEAFIWDADNGMRGLGDLAGGVFNSKASGVSADGTTIVGYGSSSDDTEAFIWDADNGMRALRSVLVEDFDLTAVLEGWTLNEASGISDDGQTIVGYGTKDGKREAWIVRLNGQTAPADSQSVPEPSIVLGTMAFGLVAWRQRRKAA